MVSPALAPAYRRHKPVRGRDDLVRGSAVPEPANRYGVTATGHRLTDVPVSRHLSGGNDQHQDAAGNAGAAPPIRLGGPARNGNQLRQANRGRDTSSKAALPDMRNEHDRRGNGRARHAEARMPALWPPGRARKRRAEQAALALCSGGRESAAGETSPQPCRVILVVSSLAGKKLQDVFDHEVAGNVAKPGQDHEGDCQPDPQGHGFAQPRRFHRKPPQPRHLPIQSSRM